MAAIISKAACQTSHCGISSGFLRPSISMRSEIGGMSKMTCGGFCPALAGQRLRALRLRALRLRGLWRSPPWRAPAPRPTSHVLPCRSPVDAARFWAKSDRARNLRDRHRSRCLATRVNCRRRPAGSTLTTRSSVPRHPRVRPLIGRRPAAPDETAGATSACGSEIPSSRQVRRLLLPQRSSTSRAYRLRPRPHRLARRQRRHEHVRVAAEECRRQIVQLHRVRAGQRHRPLDHALQLAHVARPVVDEQRVGRGRRQRQRAGPSGAARGSTCASSRMSSRRARSGGTLHSTPLSR